jgi:outer membrane protein assembly factor BamB
VKRTFCALLVFVAASTAAADFRFIHVSDIHVGAGKNAETDANMFREISALDPKPAFIAGTGDLCETGTETQYKTYRAVVDSSLTIPAHQAPGNHDVRWNPLGKEGFVKGTGQPMYQSWSYQGVHFVLLDSTTLLQHWGHFDADMLAWLKKDLAAWGRERPVIIGFHHPIGREGTQIDNEHELLELVEPYNVRLWLQGHGHSNLQWNVNGAPAVMIAGLYQGGYHVIDISADTLRITRRFLPKPKKDAELLSSKPAEAKPAVKNAQILSISLKKPVAPQWEARFEPSSVVHVLPGDLPDGSDVAMRIDGSKFTPMKRDAAGWIDLASPPLAGEHVVTVQATLKDGRAYQKWLHMTVNKSGAPQPAWQTDVGGAVMSRLVRDGEALYVPSMGGDLVAIDPSRGREQWRVKTSGGIFSTPQVDDGTIYFGSADHNIYAADARSGSVKWKTPTGGAVFGGASVANGVVCIASCDRNIYGLDAQSGSVKWKVKTGGMTQSKVATDGKLFFVGTWDNSFRAIDARSGEVAWEHKFGRGRSGGYSFYFAPAIGSPTVGGGNVFISSNDGHLHAVDIASGKIAWETQQSRQLGYCGPLYRDGRIYQASLGGNVYCFDAGTGKELWKTATGGAIYDSSPAFAGGNVYIGRVDGTFNALRAADGKMQWQYCLGPGHLLASPATDAARVYISSMSGKVTALPLN